MAVAKRCPFCLKKLRPDGTCQNPQCPRYVPEADYVAENQVSDSHTEETDK